MKTIVVIDDDIYISSLISILLEKNGYRVIKGYSGPFQNQGDTCNCHKRQGQPEG